jgi:hypothetical protein
MSNDWVFSWQDSGTHDIVNFSTKHRITRKKNFFNLTLFDVESPKNTKKYGAQGIETRIIIS